MVVQESPSSQLVPSALFVPPAQSPVAVLQVAPVMHGLVEAQLTAAPAHAPLAHASPVVQGFPSLQAVPSGLLEQAPWPATTRLDFHW